MTIVVILFIFIIEVIFIPSDEIGTPTGEWEWSDTPAFFSHPSPSVGGSLKLIIIIVEFLRTSSSVVTTLTFWYIVVGTAVAYAAWKSGSRYRGPKPTSETWTRRRWVVIQSKMIPLNIVNILIWNLKPKNGVDVEHYFYHQLDNQSPS